MTGSGPPQLAGLTFVRQLGSGGYSDVYLYQQEMPRREVAVKVLRVTGLTASLQRRFTAEANTMAGLSGHPNIVPVFSADIAPDGRPYLTMMYYPRANLAERTAAERLSVAEVLRIGIQIGGAIETAHRANVLHRDIKPANILTNQYGVPGLTDFGIAGEIAAAEDDPDIGVSIHYAPPEVLYDTAAPSVASDVYSLAATLWTLLVGRSPFSVPHHDTTPELMERVRSTPPRPTGRGDVPGSLDRLLVQALSKNPAVRPRTALDFVHALQQIEQDMHLPATQLFVESTVAPAPVRPAASGNETRVAPPKVSGVTSVAPARRDTSHWAPASASASSAPPSAPPAPADAGDGATVRRGPSVPPTAGAARERVVPRERPVDATQRRSTSVEPAAGPDTAPARGVRRWVVIGAVAVIAVAAVVVGVVLASGGSPSARPTGGGATPGLGSAADQSAVTAGAAGPPANVVVSATPAADGTVQFSWTYDNQLPDDSFLWKTDTGDTGTSDTPSLTLPVTTGAKVCLSVKVKREDGTDASADWSTPGCSA